MSSSVKWQLLYQHLKDLSQVNTKQEDLVLLVSALVSELQQDSTFIKTGSSQSLEEEISWTNHQEELA